MADADAMSHFYRHGSRLLFIMLIGVTLACILMVCISSFFASFPRRISVVALPTGTGAVVQDSGDIYGDDYPKYAPAAASSSDAMIPGGSDIMRGIDDSLAKEQAYNTALGQLATATFGAPMMQSVIDRGSLFEANDDWSPADTASASAVVPPPMTKEVMLFSI